MALGYWGFGALGYSHPKPSTSCHFFGARVSCSIAYFHIYRIFGKHKYLCVRVCNIAGQEPAEEAEPKLIPFTGVGRRLDGKTLKTGSSPVSSSSPQEKRTNASSGGTAAASSSTAQTSRKPTPGKLVFGSNSGRPKDAPKV